MYTAFATVYDRLMADVDYPKWAYFYHLLLSQFGIASGSLCECACGTGSITLELTRLGYRMTGVDLSPDMLFIASTKARKLGMGIPFIRQDMRFLKLHRPMDGVLCTNDGLNYLKDAQELQAFFTAAWEALRPGGALCFDLSTPWKLENLLGNNFIGDETEDIAYLWQNRWSPSSQSVDMNLAIFCRQEDSSYQRIGEHQRQYAHPLLLLTELLTNAGFDSVHVYADRKLQSPGPREERWFFTARKPPELG